MKKKNIIYWIIAVVVIVGGIILFGGEKISAFENLNNFGGKLEIYQSSSCGCCVLYGNYFKKQGNPDVQIIETGDLDALKKTYGVPPSLSSCHTTIVGEYFVEGHIPLKAIEKLLTEKPEIAGIAMPDMPAGSPGMPGSKQGDFIIYAVDYDGNYDEFMRI